MSVVYKVTAGPTGESQTVHVRWGSSDAAAKKFRRELMEELDIKLNEVTIETVDIPTSKGGILDWLNKNYVTE
jgi:hypothetical protein